jgi:putative glutamine amidotransferase
VVKQGFVLEEMDEFDIKCIKIAYDMKKPILGICRGHQVLNVVFGGTLYQDMSQCSESFVKHTQESRRNFASHTVDISKGSRLNSMFGDTIVTNSYHHQAVKDIAPGFTASAIAKDNVVEALEKDDELFVMSVQWHPEMMLPKHKEMLVIFKAFIDEAGKSNK